MSRKDKGESSSIHIHGRETPYQRLAFKLLEFVP